MTVFLLAWAILSTLTVLYMIFEPKFELMLTEFETYDKYTLYFLYIANKKEYTDYRAVKLFSYKIKRK